MTNEQHAATMDTPDEPPAGLGYADSIFAAGRARGRNLKGARPVYQTMAGVGDLLLISEFAFEPVIAKVDDNRTHLGHVHVLDGTSGDPRLAACIAIGRACEGCKIQGIDRDSLADIARCVLATKVYEGEKFVICLVLSSLPAIDVILDRGSYKGSRDPFDVDVAREAEKKTDSYIPVIMVNPNIPLTGLTIVELPGQD